MNCRRLNQISSLSELSPPVWARSLTSWARNVRIHYSTWFFCSIRLTRTRTPFLSLHFTPPRASINGSACPRAAVHRSVLSVKMIDKVFKGFEQVAAYVDGVIMGDSAPASHTKTIRVHSSSAYANILSSTTPRKLIWAPRTPIVWANPCRPRFARPNVENVSALNKIPMARSQD